MSLYRTYRPSTFADVVGQDHIVSTLEQAVAQDQLSHAYLFAGSRGTGKTSVARILSKQMLTKGIREPFLKNQIEKGVDDGSLVDLIEIDAASNRGIDDIRTLVEKIQFSPVVAAAKVYIIDEVHMLTREAFNALLKTLEEPPPYAYFILATTELQKIPATIQSRCQRFSFRQIRDEDIVRRLQFIADQEHIVADRASLRAIAHHAQGGMRDAISLLDQLRSLPKITVEDVQQRLGETGHEHVDTVLEAVRTGDERTILSLVDHLETAGISLETFVRQLLARVREELHAAVEANAPLTSSAHALEVLLGAVKDIRVSPVPGLVLEAALLSLCRGAETAQAPVEAPKKERTFLRKKEKEEEPERTVVSTPAPTPVKAAAQAKPKEKPADTPATLIEAPAVSVETVRQAWPSIAQQATPPSVKMSLKNGRVVDVKGKNVVLSFASKFHRDRVAQKEASHMLEDLLEKHFKQALRIECVVDEERTMTPIKDEASVDLAQAVSEIF